MAFSHYSHLRVGCLDDGPGLLLISPPLNSNCCVAHELGYNKHLLLDRWASCGSILDCFNLSNNESIVTNIVIERVQVFEPGKFGSSCLVSQNVAFAGKDSLY